MQTPTQTISPATLIKWLQDGQEIGLLDVREFGLYGLDHILLAVSLPFSRLEADLARLVPRKDTRLVVYDEAGETIARSFASRAASYGYGNVSVLAGGMADWRAEGNAGFAGVNVVSKGFGELVEHQYGVPHVTADELADMMAAGRNVIVIDGRPVHEYRRMNIPGSMCCPNGELVYRIGEIATDPATTIVVNCAGRTRSIVGAQTLRLAGIPNQVYALKNGTMGWVLSGRQLENGSDRLYPQPRTAIAATQARQKAVERGVPLIGADEAQRWIDETSRTCYLFDVRTAEEFAAGHVPRAVHAPGGQLVQATDEWVATRNARIILLDDVLVRAISTAQWLIGMGHDVSVADLEGAGWSALRGREDKTILGDAPHEVGVETISAWQARGSLVVDIRSSAAFEQGHLVGAIWSIRPELGALVEPGRDILLIASDRAVAGGAAEEVQAFGAGNVAVCLASQEEWQAAGLAVARATLPLERRTDFLALMHDRHSGNLEAARQYLEWELGLLAAMAPWERAIYRIPAAE